MIERAIALTRAGFSLVPVHYPIDGGCSCRRSSCHSVGKHPIPKEWQKAHSRKPDELKAWDKAFKSPNWGVVCGKPSGVVVLDIDVKSGGFDSLASLDLPETATVETASGGRHYYFKAPDKPVKNAVGLWPGIDFRGENGFVVSAGSRGVKGTYDWYDELTPDNAGFAPLPEFIFERVYKPPLEASKTPSVGLTQVGEGGRNVWLTSIAGSLRNKGCGYRAIYAALHYANEQCTPPLEREEVELIAKSISRYEITGGNQIL